MVERSRSVIFQPDGKIEEREFLLPDNLAIPVVTDSQIQHQNIQQSDETIVVTPIQIQDQLVIGQPNTNSELSWSSFLLIFAVLCIAIYSMRTLVRRLRELQKDFMGFSGQQKTQSLLSDMDDEWRMQKIENEALTRRNVQSSDGDFERFSGQSQVTQQTNKKTAPEKVWPQKIIFSPFRHQKPSINDDDEFKRN